MDSQKAAEIAASYRTPSQFQSSCGKLAQKSNDCIGMCKLKSKKDTKHKDCATECGEFVLAYKDCAKQETEDRMAERRRRNG